MKHALTIAGSDCSGGAGIQADLKTFAAHGIYGMSAIVSVVAENTCRVLDIQDITPDMIEKQIIAVFEDIEVHAVKVGMLSTRAGMLAVSKMLKQYRPKPVVIDPVMVAKGGCALMQEEALSRRNESSCRCTDTKYSRSRSHYRYEDTIGRRTQEGCCFHISNGRKACTD